MRTLAPYIEKLVSDHLRSHEAIVALGARVVGKTPESTAAPWVRVTQLDEGSDDTAGHLTEFLVQLDCYAGKDGGQPEANLLKRTVRAVLEDIHLAEHDATITGAKVISGIRLPDAEVDKPARERFSLTTLVWAHS